MQPSSGASPLSQLESTSITGLSARRSIDRRLGYWNIYFILKLIVYWRGLIDFHPFHNLAFFLILAIPPPASLMPGWKRGRLILALPVSVALLYYDSFLPPITRLFSSAGEVADFSLVYLIELLGRFVSIQVLGLLVGSFIVVLLARRFIRISVLVAGILFMLSLHQLSTQLPRSNNLYKKALQPGSENFSVDNVPRLTNGGTNEELNRILQTFYSTQALKVINLPKPAATALPFDLVFIHVCSLSWDDMEAAGLQLHPLWKSFDIVFRRFNSAATYSGPAAVRLNRATCGQTSNDGLYQPVAEQCYLMPSLKRAGFDINFAMNHDGHFDDFLKLIRQQGVSVDPLPLTGLIPTMKGFDDSPLQDDAAVLNRWRLMRDRSHEARTALYYNTISLHDGNRVEGMPGLDIMQSYKFRLKKLFDEIETLMQSLASGSRRTVVVLIPEHGAALRGDRMQIAGLREIPTPAITTVPVGIKIIEPASANEHDTEYVDSETSYLALSHVIAKMLAQSPFGTPAIDFKKYLVDLPITQFVAENQSVMMRVQNRTFWREDKETWRPFEP
jgi:cellulose synthase operon protein YhjU